MANQHSEFLDRLCDYQRLMRRMGFEATAECLSQLISETKNSPEFSDYVYRQTNKVKAQPIEHPEGVVGYR